MALNIKYAKCLSCRRSWSDDEELWEREEKGRKRRGSKAERVKKEPKPKV
jgi:hypothetical protein